MLVTAIKVHRYAGVMRAVGDVFNATPRDVRVLEAMGRIKRGGPPAVAVEVEGPEAPAAPPESPGIDREFVESVVAGQAPKRGRGRPRKVREQ